MGHEGPARLFPSDAKGLATRVSSGQVLNAVAGRVPWLMGGSADPAPSVKTRLTFEGAGDVSAEIPGGRNLHFGGPRARDGGDPERDGLGGRSGPTVPDS